MINCSLFCFIHGIGQTVFLTLSSQQLCGLWRWTVALAKNASFICVSWLASRACSGRFLRGCEIYGHHKAPSPPSSIDHVGRIHVPLQDFTLLETSQNQKEQDAVLIIYPQRERKWSPTLQKSSLSCQNTNNSEEMEQSSRLFSLFDMFCVDKKHILIVTKIFLEQML